MNTRTTFEKQYPHLICLEFFTCFFHRWKSDRQIFHKDFELSPSPLHCYHYYRFYCSGRCHQYHRFITISATNWSSNLGEANICLWREVQGCHMSGLYPQHAHYNDDNGDDTYNHTHDGEEGRWINVDRWYSCFGPYVFFWYLDNCLVKSGHRPWAGFPLPHITWCICICICPRPWAGSPLPTSPGGLARGSFNRSKRWQNHHHRHCLFIVRNNFSI